MVVALRHEEGHRDARPRTAAIYAKSIRETGRTSSTPRPSNATPKFLSSTKDLMLAEFARRDFSTVLDEGAAVKYGARLRDKLGGALIIRPPGVGAVRHLSR